MRRSWYCNAMRVSAFVLLFVCLLPATEQQFFELKNLRLSSGAELEFATRAHAQVLQLAGNCGHMATGGESQKMTAAVRAFMAQ